MREVSCRALDVHFVDAKDRGISASELAKGLPHTVDFLKKKQERIDWPVYLKFIANTRAYSNDDDYEQLGKRFVHTPLMRPFVAIGRLLFNAQDAYLWVTKHKVGGGSQHFSCIEAKAREVGPQHLEIELSTQIGFEPCREFFLITKGMLIDLPRVVGLSSATVKMRLTQRGAVYSIAIPKGGALLRRILKIIATPVSIMIAARELKDTYEALQQKYLELSAARSLVDKQATQLRTAFEISHVIHSDLDIAPTTGAIVRTLVDVAGFVAAQIEIENDLEDSAVNVRLRRGPMTTDEGVLQLPIAVRGKAVGSLRLWPAANADPGERLELLETVLPTVCMAVGNALTFKTVTDYKSQLEQRVVERTRELASARDSLAETVRQLEQAQAARDRIFANINHEIRTPLSLILLTVNDLERRLGDRIDSETQSRFRSIEGSVHRLLSLIDGLLLLAEGLEGKLRLKMRPFDIDVAMQRVVALWQPAAEQAQIRLSYEGLGREIVLADEAAIDRAISNLLSNAIKFTPAKGSISVELKEARQGFAIRVRDTGIGIDESFKTRIFGRFEQGRPAVRPGQRGSGIGLSIVKEIMEAHGGSAHVEANPLGGSLFTLYLPKQAPAEQPPADAPPALSTLPPPPIHSVEDLNEESIIQPAAAPSGTLLVAEDDPELRNGLGLLLSQDYRVILAPDGVAALRLAKEHLPDLLISDIGMPGIDGIELTRRFRELSGNRLAPVILLTAHASPKDRIAGLLTGAVDYVTKPFQPQELLARVRSQLTMRNLALRLHDSEKLAALGTLAAGLTHEIRNPANGVVNAIAPLRQLLPPELLEPGSPTAELVDVISTCADHIATLSRQLLGFVRQGDLVRQPTPIVEVIDRATTLAQPACANIELTRELEYHGLVPCSGALLAQVVMNLIENAAYAAGPGGHVRIRTRLHETSLRLEVSDDGPGIAPQMRAHLFEPFFTTKPPGSGTGLGLSTSRLVIERHGGTIELAPHETERGATFRVELPLDAAPTSTCSLR